MKREKAKTLIEGFLERGDRFIDCFVATRSPSLFWYFLIGPLAAMGFRQYLVGVTEQGVQFHRMNLLNKPTVRDFFRYDEIESFLHRKGWLLDRVTFHFNSGRKLKLKAGRRGGASYALVDDGVIEQIKSRMPV
jgi:hypothetical protein